MINTRTDYTRSLCILMRKVCYMWERSMIYSVFSATWAASSKSLWLFLASSCFQYLSIAFSWKQPKICTLHERKREIYLIISRTQRRRTSSKNGKIHPNFKRCHAHLLTKKYENIILSDCLSSTILSYLWQTPLNHSAAIVAGKRRKNCRSCMS